MYLCILNTLTWCPCCERPNHALALRKRNYFANRTGFLIGRIIRFSINFAIPTAWKRLWHDQRVNDVSPPSETMDVPFHPAISSRCWQTRTRSHLTFSSATVYNFSEELNWKGQHRIVFESLWKKFHVVFFFLFYIFIFLVASAWQRSFFNVSMDVRRKLCFEPRCDDRLYVCLVKNYFQKNRLVKRISSTN